jgi:hypothetical protein
LELYPAELSRSSDGFNHWRGAGEAKAVGARLLHVGFYSDSFVIPGSTAAISGEICDDDLSGLHGAERRRQKLSPDQTIRAVFIALLALMTALFSTHFSLAMS